MMKKLIALLLVLVLFLPAVTLAEDIDDDWDDDDIEIEPLDPDSYYTDEEGKLIYKIGSVELSEEELKKLEDIEAEIELDTSSV